MSEAKEPLVILQRWIGTHFFEVVTRAKGFALGRNDNDTHGFVGRDRVELALQLRQHCFR